MGMNYGFFDAEGFPAPASRSDGRRVNHHGQDGFAGGIHWEDPKTIAENTRKYELCKEEWRRRHPNTGRKFCSDGRRPRSLASTDQKDQTRGLEVAEQADKNDEWDRDA
jgi:hypothetical protein